MPFGAKRLSNEHDIDQLCAGMIAALKSKNPRGRRGPRGF
jgi:hypothetical protein